MISWLYKASRFKSSKIWWFSLLCVLTLIRRYFRQDRHINRITYLKGSKFAHILAKIPSIQSYQVTKYLFHGLLQTLTGSNGMCVCISLARCLFIYIYIYTLMHIYTARSSRGGAHVRAGDTVTARAHQTTWTSLLPTRGLSLSLSLSQCLPYCLYLSSSYTCMS